MHVSKANNVSGPQVSEPQLESGQVLSALVHRAAAGDRTAQGELARVSFRRILAYCRSQVSQLADAEELAQETLLRALLNLPALGDQTRFDAWLRGIASHVCADWHRRRHVAAKQLADAELSEHRDPAEQAEVADERMMLNTCISELSEELREVIFLFYYEDYTYDEMASWLGVARATVSERLSRARNLLKSRLSQLRSFSS